MVVLRGNARYQRGHRAQYSGFKLATSTFVLSILEFIFVATSHKHCALQLLMEIKTYYINWLRSWATCEPIRVSISEKWKVTQTHGHASIYTNFIFECWRGFSGDLSGKTTCEPIWTYQSFDLKKVENYANPSVYTNIIFECWRGFNFMWNLWIPTDKTIVRESLSFNF